MKKITTYGSIKGGKLNIHYRNRFLKALSLMADCRVELIVKKVYKNRSLPQNAYYWSVIVGIAAECISEAWSEEVTSQQAHEVLKSQCNAKDLVAPDGLVTTAPASTATLTTVEAEEYYERCRMWLKEFFGADVPLPNEQTEIKL